MTIGDRRDDPISVLMHLCGLLIADNGFLPGDRTANQPRFSTRGDANAFRNLGAIAGSIHQPAIAHHAIGKGRSHGQPTAIAEMVFARAEMVFAIVEIAFAIAESVSATVEMSFATATTVSAIVEMVFAIVEMIFAIAKSVLTLAVAENRSREIAMFYGETQNLDIKTIPDR